MPSFCPNCGSSLAKPEPLAPSLCPRCGTDTTPAGPPPPPKFCPTCGYRLMTLTSQIRPSTPRGQGGTPEARWFARFVIVVLIVILGLVLLNNAHEGLVVGRH